VEKFNRAILGAVIILFASMGVTLRVVAAQGAASAPSAQAAGPGRSATPSPPASAADMIAPTIPLWDGAAPGAMGDGDADKPTLTIYRAAGNTVHPAVIIAPGGSYSHLAMTYEGRDVATWMNSLGVTAFVLRYRLTPYHYPIELEDAQRAIRLVRTRATEFGIDPARLGMMGFSAGGHLTSTAGTHFDAGDAAAADPIDWASSRPDFLILAYPVISFQEGVLGTADVLRANGSSGRNLLGDNPDPQLLVNLSNELQVTAQTPPTFLYHCTTDKTVPVESSVAFYLALKKAGVPAELHIFENGAHGGGLALGDPGRGMWSLMLEGWMRDRGIIGK
jgi:acetyl esterase/lipase